MAELQQLLSQWLGDLASLIPVGYPFAAGMISAVNPCGFAMLPAYLGLFLGRQELSPASVSTVGIFTPWSAAVPAQIIRAIWVAAAVTVGFVLLFSSVGALISLGGQLIIPLVPWIAVGIGVGLVLLGLAMFRGYHVSANFSARLASQIGNRTLIGPAGFFLFGISYGLASLSCTLPIFLTVVGGSLAAGGFTKAVSQFLSYSLGMGLIILFLSLGLALLKSGLVGFFRQVIPYVERISAALLILAGSYIIYYWLFKGGLISVFS